MTEAKVMINIHNVREQFPITKKMAFLNHAGLSPSPDPVRKAMQGFLEKCKLNEASDSCLDECRELFAKLVNAKPEEIALVPNTSTGLNVAANILGYPSGCNVVTADLEFPSVVYPWLRNSLKPKVEVRYVRNVKGRLRLEDFEKAIDDHTVAVAVSHVEYPNGFRNDLRGLSEDAHKHGARLIVDVCQSAGALKIDVEKDGVDFLATSAYKWMLGPCGAGFLYVKKGLIAEAEPVMVGWASVKQGIFETADLWNNRDLMLADTAARFETGTPSLVGYIGAAAALSLLLRTGVKAIENRIISLTSFLIEGLKKKGFKLQTVEEPPHRSGIVNFRTDKPEARVEKLSKEGIIVSARMNGIRVSPHFYNTEEELEKLLSRL
jgi:cysteine desulfurase/selenocysteine lyase